MNAPHPFIPVTANPAAAIDNLDEISLAEYWDIVLDNRWLITIITVLTVMLGVAYAFLAKPIYEANLLIQVEDSAGSAKSLFGDAAGLFDVKTAATAEIEILRSRMVIGQAVQNALLYIEARPHYLPLVGDWMARRSTQLSNPGWFGVGGWVMGSERITVKTFDVPERFESSEFILTARGNGSFVVTHPNLGQVLTGSVGSLLSTATAAGTIKLLVTDLDAKDGAEFVLIRHSKLRTLERLQQELKLSEKGRQSGVIDASLQDTDRARLTTTLNEIGNEYVKQNIERKAAEAQKTLSFLDVQLPQFKKQLDQSEEAYNRYRNQQGTVSLDEEAKLILARSIDLQSKLVEAQQKRVELAARFTSEHPAIKTLDQQIGAWNREISALNARIKGLPSVQQDALRLERDVKVNNELYQQMRNNALQLQLIREGKIGNVRLIDAALTPEIPVKPKKGLILPVSGLIGVALGLLLAFARNAFFRGIRNPQEIEAHTGLNVYATIPLSKTQEAVAGKVVAKERGLHVLSHVAPQDVAVESLRSLRTALQFAMLDAANNRLLITGATPGVGKSFVSTNFAAVLAAGGKRVLLIDADLRKGHLHQYFGIERGGGFSELIAGTLSERDAIRREVLPRLDLITTGMLPPNPAELIMSSAFKAVLDRLSAPYDLVIIDTAPVLVAADTLSAAAHAHTLLLVARANETQLGELHEAARRLAYSGRTATGVLFNALDLSRRHYGAYGYKYGSYRYKQYEYQLGQER
jgi:tyrosine-protein kinase Etk/Wzc